MRSFKVWPFTLIAGMVTAFVWAVHRMADGFVPVIKWEAYSFFANETVMVSRWWDVPLVMVMVAGFILTMTRLFLPVLKKGQAVSALLYTVTIGILYVLKDGWQVDNLFMFSLVYCFLSGGIIGMVESKWEARPCFFWVLFFLHLGIGSLFGFPNAVVGLVAGFFIGSASLLVLGRLRQLVVWILIGIARHRKRPQDA